MEQDQQSDMSSSSDEDCELRVLIDEENEANCNEQMRLLLSKSVELKEASERGEDSCVEETTRVILQADEVLKRAKCSSTAYLDALILHAGSIVYRNYSDKIDNKMNEFKAKEYAEHFLAYLENKADDQNMWTSFEDESSLIFMNSGGWSWQMGAIAMDDDVPAGQKQRRTKRECLIDVPMKNPKEMQKPEKEEDDLEHHMQNIMSVICKYEKVNKNDLQFWELVLHPNLFSKTVENIYYMSHMVKEGLVHISLDSNGLPIVKTRRRGGGGGGGDSGDVPSIPVAVTINMHDYEELVEACEITQPMIP